MLLKLAKFFVFSTFVYILYIKNIIIIPYFLQLFGAGAFLFILLHMWTYRSPIKNGFSTEIVWWLIFASESFFVGIFIAFDQSVLISSILTYVQFLILTIILIYVCNYEKTIDFILFIGKWTAAFCAIHTALLGEQSGWGERIAMTENANTNSLGILMVFGTFCILYSLNLRKNWSLSLNFLLISLFTYITFLTASRKSFIALCILFACWVLFSLKYKFKDLSSYKKVFMVFFGVIITICLTYVLIPNLNDMVVFNRLQSLLQDGDETRENMYYVAWELFKGNLLFGVGFDQYKVVSGFGKFSHSTYAEALSTFGIMGSILYFIPYIMLLSKYTKMFFFKKIDSDTKSGIRLILGIYFVYLFLGIGIVHYYEPTTYMVFAALISFYKINKSQNNHEKKSKRKNRKE